METTIDTCRRAPSLSGRSATLCEVIFDAQDAGHGSHGIYRQMKPQPAQLPACDAVALAVHYIYALIGWWSPGEKAQARGPEDAQRDAEQRWEEEGGNLSVSD
jgi:hypothetical protein